MTAATELRVSAPTHIVLATKETRIHIFEAGPRALIVLVTPPSHDETEIRAALRPVPRLEVRWLKGGGHVAFPRRLDVGLGEGTGADAQVLGWLRTR